MTYEVYIKKPMQMVQLNLNMISSESAHLINASNRSFTHPSNKKFSNIPFPKL